MNICCFCFFSRVCHQLFVWIVQFPNNNKFCYTFCMCGICVIQWMNWEETRSWKIKRLNMPPKNVRTKYIVTKGMKIDKSKNRKKKPVTKQQLNQKLINRTLLLLLSLIWLSECVWHCLMFIQYIALLHFSPVFVSFLFFVFPSYPFKNRYENSRKSKTETKHFFS